MAAARRWCDATTSVLARAQRTSGKCRAVALLSCLARPQGRHSGPGLPVRSARCFASSISRSRKEQLAEVLGDSDADSASASDSDSGDFSGDDDEEEDEFGTDEEEIQIGDGSDGGGVALGGTSWGAKALEIANSVLPSSGDLALYGFKASESGMVQLRLDKLSDEYGSPTLEEVTSFSSCYGALLEEAGRAGLVPDNLSLEVSSPGAERVVHVPGDLNRFRELPMLVRYVKGETGSDGRTEEEEAVLELDSFDLETQQTVWKLANVRLNRQSLGKGRVFNKKQREWRLHLTFSSIKLIRLHVDL